MHGNHASIHALLEDIRSIHLFNAVEVAVCPPFVYFEKAHWQLRHSKVRLGAQNVSEFNDGPYTGEISANMLKDSGCCYVLIGHSERRHLLGETNEIIAEKFLRAVQAELRPVLCVGETAKERAQHQTEQIVLAQLKSVLNLPAGIKHLAQLVVAYEPVWAIGTGLTASPAQAQEVHQLLRQIIAEYDKNLAAKVPIIYGGSVKAENAKQLFMMPDIDGALVGGASLIGKEFCNICHLAEF